MINRSVIPATLCALVIGVGNSPPARADVISDWNQTACDVVAKVGPGAPGHRMIAVAQVAVFEAVNAIDPRYVPYMPRIQAPPGASVDAAVAAANRAVLLALMPWGKVQHRGSVRDCREEDRRWAVESRRYRRW